MKYIVFVFLFSSSLVFGQGKASYQFENSNYDFGTIKEENGPVTYGFEFINNGSEPLIISNVKPSCGCTTPSWTKAPVMSGEKGIITVQYNPRNRPGAFRKYLTVTSNGEESIIKLYINGNVIPKIKSIEEELPAKIGALRFKHNSVNVGRITTEKLIVKSFDVYNDSENAFTFQDSILAPSFITITFEPKSLNAKEKGKLIISYNPVHDDNLGFNSHNVRFFTDEAANNEKEIHVMASIIEYFAPLSDEEKTNAPKLLIENRIHNFGKLKQGELDVHEFVLTNGGKSPLNIRSYKSNCKCAVAVIEDLDLKPGKSTILTVKFNSAGRRGSQLKSITIFSNDPIDPTQIVSVRANVVVD